MVKRKDKSWLKGMPGYPKNWSSDKRADPDFDSGDLVDLERKLDALLGENATRRLQGYVKARNLWCKSV